MSEFLMSADDSAAVNRTHFVGFALILLAFCMPPLAAVLGYEAASQLASDTGYTAGSLLFLAFIAWLATRRASDMTKARARVAVGLILCILVAGELVKNANDEKQAKDFLREAIAFNAKGNASVAELERRFENVDISTVLSPENMTVLAARAAARSKLAEFRALLAERRLLLQTQAMELERFMASIPQGRMRDKALTALEAAKARKAKLQSDVDASLTALVDSLSAVLDWGEVQAGELGVRNGQLLFVSERQQVELRGLLEEVEQAKARLNEVVQRVSAEEARLQKSMREAEQFLQE